MHDRHSRSKPGTNSLGTDPDPELIRSMYERGLRPQVLRMALLLDVFFPLAEGPADAAKVARACSSDPMATGLLLDALHTFGLLTKEDGRYGLTPTALTFLVPGRPAYAGDWILEQTNPELFADMLQSIRSGNPFQRDVPWEQLAWLESYDLARLPVTLEMWAATEILSEQAQNLRILDLGCGCGIGSFVLLQAQPRARVTCVDTEEVLPVAGDLARRMDVLDRAVFAAGDLHSTELGQSCADVVLLGNITNFFTPGQNLELLQRIHQALAPNGLVVVNVTMLGNELNSHLGLYALINWAFAGTNLYHYETYKEWLKQAGFSRVRQLSKLWLSAKK